MKNKTKTFFRIGTVGFIETKRTEITLDEIYQEDKGYKKLKKLYPGNEFNFVRSDGVWLVLGEKTDKVIDKLRK